MSLKSIEMQIAIPRTTEAGMVQNQLLHKPVADQTNLAEQASKMTEEMRHKNGKVDETTGLNIREKQQRDQPRKLNKRYGKNNNQAKEEEAERVEHPYKGHHIDLSL